MSFSRSDLVGVVRVSKNGSNVNLTQGFEFRSVSHESYIRVGGASILVTYKPDFVLFL